MSYNIITVFLVLFSSIHCILYFISFHIVSQSTIGMYYLHVHVSLCIHVYTHGHDAQCIKK